jgi:hypothetical protein
LSQSQPAQYPRGWYRRDPFAGSSSDRFELPESWYVDGTWCNRFGLPETWYFDGGSWARYQMVGPPQPNPPKAAQLIHAGGPDFGPIYLDTGRAGLVPGGAMPRRRWSDFAQLIAAAVFLAILAFLTVVALFVEPVRWLAFLWFLGYCALMLYVNAADEPADPNTRLPPRLEVAFRGGWVGLGLDWEPEKGRGVVVAAICLGMIFMLVAFLFTEWIGGA